MLPFPSYWMSLNKQRMSVSALIPSTLIPSTLIPSTLIPTTMGQHGSAISFPKRPKRDWG